MACANLSPPDRRRAEQLASRVLRLQSPDPVTRWRAREEQISEYAQECAGELLRQAERNRRAFEAQERACERMERENYKYKTLPQGAKITK